MADHPLQDALQRLGVPRVEAALVAYFQDAQSAATKEVMDATGLRQPEVSVGMRLLKERGWVESRPIPREGKGRPMNEYHRLAEPATVRDHYEAHADATIQSLKAAWSDAGRLLDG